MKPHNEPSVGIGERRRSVRRETDLQLEVEIDARRVSGQAENISSAGVFFFSADPLNVTVRIRDEAGSQSYTGKLVRVERLSPDMTGYAIEFDRA